MIPSPTTVAVDLGGSWLRTAASTEGRGVSETTRRKAVPPHQLPDLLQRLWERRRWEKVNRLIVGSKGIWTLPERKKLAAALAGLARSVSVMSDVELALHAAFGRTGRGILVVAGTGSIAVGWTARGRLKRAGGRGPAHGDEGSGWWMGKEYLRRRLQGTRSKGDSPLTPANVRRTAGLAARVLKRAATDSLCAKIQREAQEHIAALVVAVGKRWKSPPLPVSWGGALMKNPAFRNGVGQALQVLAPGRFHFAAPPENPERTAALHPDYFPQRPPAEVPPRFRTKK